MKRRDFLKRISAAATAFVVTPTAFRCLPAAQKVREVVAPSVGSITRASISCLTPAQLEAIFQPGARFHFADYEAHLFDALEGGDFKRPLGLYDFIMSRPNPAINEALDLVVRKAGK